jgi:putative ABC transport system permease protein
VVLRGASARKLRLALTVSAIVVGVAFLSGTLVLTATVRAAMRQQVGTTAPGLDVEVTPVGGFANRVSLTTALADRVGSVPGAAVTEGEVLGPIVLVGRGQPSLDAVGVSVTNSAGLRGFDLKSGHYPSGPGQVVVDDSTLRAQRWAKGIEIAIAGTGPAQEFTIVGVVGPDTAQGLQGTPVAAFTLPVAQQLLGLAGRYTEIAVTAAPGVTPSALANRITQVIGPQYQVLTADQIENNAVTADFKAFSLLSSVLVVLGAIVLFVAAFLVVNTFSIVVAQRTRELALLRCLGASRAQLMYSVLAEALVVGVVAAALGVALGIAAAVILLTVLPGVGLDLPSVAPAIHAVAVLVPLALGAGATLAACVLPALRATSVPAIAALRDDPVAETARSSHARGLIGTVTLAVGVGLLLAGLFADLSHEGDIVGAGAVLAFIGLASLSPLVARPLARTLGWPLVASLGLPAFLARQNAMRNPRRTASTSAALLVGVALVSFMAVITASARASATNNIAGALRAGFVVEGDTSGAIPLGSGLVSSLRSQRALSTVVPVSFVRFKVDGGGGSGFVVDPSTYSKVVDLGNVKGSMAALGSGTVAVSSPVATSNAWHLGQPVDVDFGEGNVDRLVICAIFPTGDNFGGLLFSSVHPPAGLGRPVASRVFVEGIVGLNPSIVRAAIVTALARFPQAQIQDDSSLETSAINQVNQIVNLITVILILAVVIGLVGIVNTLALSVLERTREIGLLRALGMSRTQVKAMVRHESVIVALLGAVAGVIVGLFLAWAMQHSLVDQGLTLLRVPIVTLVVYLVVAAASGVVAGILPARRAADLDVLAAIYAE